MKIQTGRQKNNEHSVKKGTGNIRYKIRERTTEGLVQSPSWEIAYKFAFASFFLKRLELNLSIILV